MITLVLPGIHNPPDDHRMIQLPADTQDHHKSDQFSPYVVQPVIYKNKNQQMSPDKYGNEPARYTWDFETQTSSAESVFLLLSQKTCNERQESMTYPTLGIVTEDSAMFVARITCIDNDVSDQIKKTARCITYSREHCSILLAFHLANLFNIIHHMQGKQV